MPTRVVLFAPNWLGDVVMALPAMAAVRRHFGGADLAAAARASVAPLLASVPAVDRVIVIDSVTGPRELAAGRFDVAVLFPNSFSSAWLARRAGIPERWGYNADARRWLLTRRVVRPRGRLHQSEYYGRLIEALGMPVDRRPLAPLVAPPSALTAAGALLERHGWPGRGRVVVLAPGAAYGHAKRWPPARFAALAAGLIARHGVVAVLVGGPSDRDAALAIAADLDRLGAPRAARDGTGAGWIDLVGETTLPQLMAVASQASAFVSNDSGAMHLAAAMGVPVTAVFGATDERATGPMAFGGRTTAAGGHRVLTAQAFCRPCLLRECPIDHRCMKRIGAEQVLAAVEQSMLAAAGPGS